MDTLSAFAMGQANRHKPSRTFDWNKAAQIIVERKATQASAGLSGDLEYTEGEILEDGQPTDGGSCYLSSTWAIPVLIIDGEEIDCFCDEEGSGWNSQTVWPESAKKIFADRTK